MKRAVLLMTVFLASTPAFAAQGNIGQFLKACAWGTGLGAAAGAVSLAFEEKPSEHTINVARGASLGLYAGIAYGLMQANSPEIQGEIVQVLPILDPERAGVLALFRF